MKIIDIVVCDKCGKITSIYWNLSNEKYLCRGCYNKYPKLFYPKNFSKSVKEREDFFKDKPLEISKKDKILQILAAPVLAKIKELYSDSEV